MPANPKVSICIPSYNHARFLPAALDSALAQTYKDFEIVLTDDGSTDGSLEIARNYAVQHPAIVRVFTHPEERNLGIAATGNLNLRMSRGELWAGLCSDDVWYPDKLECQVAFLEAHPEIGFVYGRADLIDDQGCSDGGEKMASIFGGTFGRDISREPDPLTRLLLGNAIPADTVMARRQCFETLGHEEASLVNSDWELWIRFMDQYKIGFIDKPLVKYRIHDSNTSIGNSTLQMQRTIDVLLSLQKKSPGSAGALAALRIQAMIALQLSYFYFELKNPVDARERLFAAFQTDQSLRTDIRYLEAWLDVKANPAFSVWTVDELTAIVDKRLINKLAGRQFAKAACRFYQAGDRRQANEIARRCLLECPRAINKSVVYILLQAIVGRNAMEQARRLRTMK